MHFLACTLVSNCNFLCRDDWSIKSKQSNIGNKTENKQQNVEGNLHPIKEKFEKKIK